MELGYVTASQGRIYIDGILIDECYDIRYSYQESKEPIYGYNSKHFNTILSGQVIIHGSFTINYVHDAYLKAVLDRIEKETNPDPIKRKYKTTELDNKFKENAIAFKQKHGEIKGKTQEKKVIQGQNVELEAQKTLEENRISQTKQDLTTKYNDAKKTTTDFLNNLTQEQRDQYQDDKNYVTDASSKIQEHQGYMIEDANKMDQKISQVVTANMDPDSAIDTVNNMKQEKDLRSKSWMNLLNQEKQGLDDYINNRPVLKEGLTLEYTEQQALNNLNSFDTTNNTNLIDDQIDQNINKIDKLNIEIGQLEEQITSIKEDLRKDKTQRLANGNDIVGYLEGLQEKDKPTKRAEDHKKGFNIMIDFNGGTHAIIKDCHLLGRSFAIEQSGEPVRESYAFIGRDIQTYLGA